jgi:predicted DNA-binding antitoxin AbrB/MazE fold protein
MVQAVQAIYENGVLKPLQKLNLGEHQQVQLIINSDAVTAPGGGSTESDYPLKGLCCDTGIADLAEHFDDYRFGRRTP